MAQVDYLNFSPGSGTGDLTTGGRTTGGRTTGRTIGGRTTGGRITGGRTTGGRTTGGRTTGGKILVAPMAFSKSSISADHIIITMIIKQGRIDKHTE